MQSRSLQYFARVREPFETQVLRQIVYASPVNGLQLSDVQDDSLLLRDHLLYDDRQLARLCSALQSLLFNTDPSKRLDCTDVSACKSIKDVVSLMNNILKPAQL